MTPVLVIPGTDVVVCFDAESEDLSMRRHFMDECGWTEDQFAEIEEFDWFSANVSLWLRGELLGEEFLGACCYKTEDEFYTVYRGDYFADMVHTLVMAHGDTAAKAWVEKWHAEFRSIE